MKCPKVAKKNQDSATYVNIFSSNLFFFKIFVKKWGETFALSLDKAPFKAAAKVEATRYKLRNNSCIAVRMNLGLVKKDQDNPGQETQLMPQKLKLHRVGFFSGPQFQFQCALCVKQNQIVQFFVFTIFAQNSKILQSSNLNTLR